MYCTKCGAQIPEGSKFCNSCGAPVASEGAKAPSLLSQWSLLIKLDPVLAIIPVGSLLILVGAFLPWETWGEPFFRFTVLGLQIPGGAVVFALGVLFPVVLVLSRSGTPGAWGVVMLLLGALALTLIFQTMYHINDVDHSIRAGVYVAMVGALVTACAGVIEQVGIRKK